MSAYIDEVSAELDRVNPKEGESISEIYKKAIQAVEDKHNAHLKFRQDTYHGALASHSEQLNPIKERIVYTEEVPEAKNIELTEQDKQELADELNRLCDLKGDKALTPESSLGYASCIWHGKYVSMPFSMRNQKAEAAIFEMFPKYKTHSTNASDGFKYEPLYRFIRVDDTEAFLKQFDEIGGVYEPKRLQSCSKHKYYGECYSRGFGYGYNFGDWESNYNIKFVIHPKGEVTKAIDIGEGKYGSCEAIYPADSQFKILGKVKRKVTPEEIKEMGGVEAKFDDFERWEIHLQEM